MPPGSDLTVSVAVISNGKENEIIPFEAEMLLFGRDPECHVSLPDTSVSRRHAELRRDGGTFTLIDSGSRNGLKVNGVPRKQATLIPGDSFEIGIYSFRLKAGQGSKLASRPSLQVENQLGQTVRHQTTLPELREARHLAVIYHACFWITECEENQLLQERLCNLLHDALKVTETQFYHADLTLGCREGEGKKPAMKLAPFLAARFQSLPEATMILGEEIARHQRGVGDYHYLVCPIRRATQKSRTTNDFIVLLKPSEWLPFSVEDRVLLQAVCQLWASESAKLEKKSMLQKENTALKAARPTSNLLGKSPLMERLRTRLIKSAGTKASILLLGETGSGKEVVAQFIHEQSPRSALPLIKVNCSAIPEGLIESELFGHRRGAFTDARENRLGKFAQANGGTILLDEIGELPPAAQAKVLRVLENGEIEPLGGEAPQKVDVRVIAATHRNLEEMVTQGRFRQDLLFRLNVVSVIVPPLREHLEDLPELTAHFISRFCEENGLVRLTLSKEALTLLARHSWPGNVRELRNVIQRCAINAEGAVVSAADVKSSLP
jgi:pSer/pThr/pTyr-binding forkhead associated (FHA) protein